MHVTRIGDAAPYETVKHYGMSALRLQGFDASPSDAFWVGLSTFLPAGGAESSATQIEKVYIALEGTITIETDAGSVELSALDSIYLAPGERRSIENRTNLPAVMLVVMPYPEQA